MKHRNSFTLIEILVVIAVLSALVALLVPNFMEIRMKARDNRRKSDLTNIQKGLELYKQNRTPITYPTALPSPCAQFVDLSNPTSVIMQKLPSEPLYNCVNNYYYKIDPVDTTKYVLYACLENANDAEAVACPLDFSTTTNMSCGTSNNGKCYKLIEP